MKLNKLIKIDKQHAERMYAITIEKLQTDQDKHAKQRHKRSGKLKRGFASTFIITLLLLGFAFASEASKETDIWKITAYCACERCCAKKPSDPAYGITASGKHVKYGMVALNWLSFGTKVKIDTLGVFTVQDRGAKSLFGSKHNHIKHIDLYLPSHKEARQFGVKWLKVEILASR